MYRRVTIPPEISGDAIYVMIQDGAEEGGNVKDIARIALLLCYEKQPETPLLNLLVPDPINVFSNTVKREI